MTRRRVITVAALGLMAVLLAGCGEIPAGPPGSSRDAARPGVGATAHAARLPLLFTADPTDGSSFAVRSAGAAALFRRGSVRFERAGNGLGAPVSSLDLEFVGASRDAVASGVDRAPTTVNYFTGKPARWRVALPAFRGLRYDQLWSGVDLQVEAAGGGLKYAFTVAPGADASRIHLRYREASAHVDGHGALVLEAAGARITDPPPVAWQERDGSREPVDAAFSVSASADGGVDVTFDLGPHDPARPLVIDPAFPVYAGFFGGPGDDRALCVAVDGTGAAYVTGQSPSPLTGTVDAYVAKVSPDGSQVDYFSVLGGTGFDAGFDIAVDTLGQAYVTGATTSDESTFPVAAGPDVTFNGRIDAWVAKLAPAGNALVFAGYLGGAATDFAEGVALGPSGEIFLTGVTQSSERSFPVKIGPDLTFNGRYDAFVAALGPNPTSSVVGDNVLYAGYVGGQGNDVGVVAERGPGGLTLTSGQIAVDAEGSAYVSGMTDSNQRSFPDGDGFGAVPGFDETANGGTDAFVVKVRPGGAGLAYATYIGGSSDDRGFGMAVDSAGAAYLTGETTSDERTFPVLVGPDLSFNGDTDAFVAKLAPPGTALEYAGYLGGSGFDQGLGVALRPGGSVVVVGHTHTGDGTFPVVDGPDSTFNGPGGDNGDAFVASVKPVPDAVVVTDNLEFCGFIGGDGEDAALWVATDANGGIYVVGDTSSGPETFPAGEGIGVLTTFDANTAGGVDGFLVKITTS